MLVPVDIYQSWRGTVNNRIDSRGCEGTWFPGSKPKGRGGATVERDAFSFFLLLSKNLSEIH
ncbi:hypothetical protein AUJ42_00355 [Candidatus Collierbacteria bacterium CG1_02_44_10]|uniref:Uncharacterized protein n=1 Tax=Candidatus Collierbacteria bacterium CG1_02_44_10 TaxID=1805087 RepID=A0A1J4S1E7_9BACT|nr:MAG: hypothetical protein AUJ42_00355 [Candidatus Collierbacteria bacterium CG1_02_44_10]